VHPALVGVDDVGGHADLARLAHVEVEAVEGERDLDVGELRELDGLLRSLVDVVARSRLDQDGADA